MDKKVLQDLLTEALETLEEDEHTLSDLVDSINRLASAIENKVPYYYSYPVYHFTPTVTWSSEPNTEHYNQLV